MAFRGNLDRQNFLHMWANGSERYIQRLDAAANACARLHGVEYLSHLDFQSSAIIAISGDRDTGDCSVCTTKRAGSTLRELHIHEQDSEVVPIQVRRHS